MAKFRISKIGPGDPKSDADSVYFERIDNSGIYVDWYYHFVSDSSGNAKKLAIPVTPQQESTGMYFPDLTANWPTGAIGQMAIRTADDNLPSSYAGERGLARGVVMNSDFDLAFDPALGTWILGVSGAATGMSQFKFTLQNSGAENVFDVLKNGLGAANTQTIADNDDLQLEFSNQNDKKVLMAPRATASAQPDFRQFYSGTADAVPASDADRSDVYFEGYPGSHPAGSFPTLIRESSTAGFGKVGIFSGTYFQLDTVSSEHEIKLAQLNDHAVFAGARSGATLNDPVERLLYVGGVEVTGGTEGDINWETANSTALGVSQVGRVSVVWGTGANFGKQVQLDPTYFVKSSTGDTTDQDMLSLDAGALGQQYTAGQGMFLETNEFGFSDNGTTNNLTGKNYGIDFQTNHVRLAYNNTQFLINGSGELEIAPGVLGGSEWKSSVRVATDAALAGWIAAGSGIGKTLTAPANGTTTIDGVVVALNDRVLVKNQSGAGVPDVDNGIYLVTQAGDGANPTILTRATDSDEDVETNSGDTVTSLEGTVNTSAIWRLVTADPITVDTTAQQWEKIAVFAITDGNGLWLDDTQNNKITVRNVNDSLEVGVGDTVRGILFQADYFQVDIDSTFFKFNPTTDDEWLTMADLANKSVIAGTGGTPSILAATVASHVLKNNDANTALEWGLITDTNIDNNANINLFKLQDINSYSMIANNTASLGPPNSSVLISPQSVVIRKAGTIQSEIIGSGDFLARPTSGDLQSADFDSDNFEWSGTTLQAKWAQTAW